MVEVKCSVSSCWFWDDGNLCGADAIEVSNDTDDTRQDAAGAKMTAAISSQTRCETFRPQHETEKPEALKKGDQSSNR